MQIFVRNNQDGSKHTLEVATDFTLERLKREIAAITKIEKDNVEIVLGDETLSDPNGDMTITDLGIKKNAELIA